MTTNSTEELSIHIIPTQYFKTSMISVLFALPLKKETASANAILPFILRRTCAEYPTPVQLNKRLAELYGAEINVGVTKLGENQIIRFNINMISDRFTLGSEKIVAKCIELLNSILFNPSINNGEFLNNDVDREKRLLLEKLESEMNEKRVYALKRCQEIMFKNEDFGVDPLGNIEDISSLTGTQIYNAYKNMLETAKISIICIGEEIESSLDILKNSFSSIDRHNINSGTTNVVRVADKEHFVEEKLPVNQGKLVLGLRTAVAYPDEDVMKTRVMSDILGGGPYSLLFTNVREKMSLCYYCSARYNPQKGVIFVQSGIEDENRDKAIDGIKQQLERIKNGEFEEQDFRASISSLIDTYSSISDTPETLSEWYAMQMLENSISQPSEYIEKLKLVTRDDVVNVANKVTIDTIYMLAGEVNK